MQFRVYRYIKDKFILPQNFCCAIFSAIAFTGRLSIDCWIIPAVIVKSYLVIILQSNIISIFLHHNPLFKKNKHFETGEKNPKFVLDMNRHFNYITWPLWIHYLQKLKCPHLFGEWTRFCNSIYVIDSNVVCSFWRICAIMCQTSHCDIHFYCLIWHQSHLRVEKVESQAYPHMSNSPMLTITLPYIRKI